MISKLTGTLIHADLRFVVVDVQGVGYKVYTTSGTLEKQLGQSITFWTYLAVRENALDLFGFQQKEELDLFESLITVSSIGPKTALGILSMANPATIRKAVITEDPGYLTKVSGISKKTSEKIVLELKGKLTATQEEGEEAGHAHESDSLEALKSLGYPEKEARDALKKVPAEVTDAAECVKLALKILSKN